MGGGEGGWVGWGMGARLSNFFFLQRIKIYFFLGGGGGGVGGGG